MSGFDVDRLARLHRVAAQHVEHDRVGGVAWLAAREGDAHAGVAGTLTRGEPEPVRRDSLFRISSMTKPIAGVAALILVEECRLRLEDPVDDLLPELADRRCSWIRAVRSTATPFGRSVRSPCTTSSRPASGWA